MRFILVVSEAGLILLDENMLPLSNLKFSAEDAARSFLDSSLGAFSQDQISWLKGSIDQDSHILADPAVLQALASSGIRVEPLGVKEVSELGRKKIELIYSSGLATSHDEAEKKIRDISLAISTLRVREMSAKPDLQAMESVQALDEIDKTANIISSRVREWYGLHFPELTSMTDDNISLIKLILTFRTREKFDADELEKMGNSKNKSKAIVSAAAQSRGADLREEDISRIIQLSEEAQHLFNLRDKLANHVERTMRQFAPNVSEVAGETIGARLIARAGGLEKLAMMPASTIQILGAEKALYRALKSGSRPPKHGILFQHAAVHGAPKWQRGKIARSVAGKIAIAARIDAYRGTKDETVGRSLQERLDEIKVKYKDAPKEKKSQFIPQIRRGFDREHVNRGGHEGRGGWRDRKKRRRGTQRERG